MFNVFGLLFESSYIRDVELEFGIKPDDWDLLVKVYAEAKSLREALPVLTLNTSL